MVTAWTSSRFKDLLCGLWSRADPRARFYRPRLEALEDRDVPSTLPVIWDGGGKTNLWTDRLNWQSDVAPVAGDDLVFPAVAAQKTNLNDFPKDTLFNSLTFSGTGYAVSGKSNRLDLGPGGIIDSVSGATGTNSYDGPILLTGVRTINVTASGSRQELELGGVLSGIGGFIKTGAGTLTFKGLNANTFQASAFVSEGLVQLSKGGATPGAIPGFLTITGGEVRLAADNQIADDAFVSLSSAGGVLNLNGHSDTIGPLSMTGGSVVTGAGVLTLNGDVTARAAQSGITFVSSAISGNLALGASRRIFTVGSHAPDLVIDQASGGVLIKDGGGVLELRAGHVSSIDEVDVIAGTLMVNGDLSASTAGLETNVVLQDNGTVSGQGRVLGPLATPSSAVDYLDDGSTGFTATTGWGKVTGRGFDNDIKQAKPAIVVGDQTATWTFTGLTAGL